jgi:putative spermidine/putrescine transport system permease protein
VIGRLLVLTTLAFMTLPTVVVVVASFNPTAILSFPPDGLSLRWYEQALTYPQFRRAAVNSLIVTGASAVLALPIGTSATRCRHRPSGVR